MSEAKPTPERRIGWIEQKIQASMARGEFDNLPGAGRPLPGLEGAYDPRWWVKSWLRREGFEEMADRLDTVGNALPHEPRPESALERLRRKLKLR